VTAVVLGCVPALVLAQSPLPIPPPGLGGQLPQSFGPAPITLTPAITVFEEYNDNLFLNNANRRSDWITAIAPGFTLTGESETYKLRAGYSFTAETYAHETSQNEVFDRQNLSLNGSYRASPRLTFTLTDSYIASVNTSLVSENGVATGRSRAWSNAVAPGAAWQVTPVTTLRLSGTYVAQRFEARDLDGSDVYRLLGTVEQRLTARFSGTTGYEFAYLDVERQRPATTHMPRLGGVYRFTETLTGIASGGPTLVLQEGTRDRVALAASASLLQRFQFGSASVQYERTVATAGGLGGTTDNDAVAGLLQVANLARGFVLELGPRYTRARSDDGRIDVHTFTLGLRSSYRLTTWLTVFAGYAFFQQRSSSTPTGGGGAALAADVDQNRVSFGLQIGYPLRFD
jgi:hypothetical protein